MTSIHCSHIKLFYMCYSQIVYRFLTVRSDRLSIDNGT